MDLYQVRYFLTIAETGTFSRAAERLYLSQPSLSTGIKKLEQELGVSLFERGGRRTVLTPAGRLFMDKATVIMDQYESALSELKGFANDSTLRLGVLSSMRVSLLAELVRTFQQQHPHVTVELNDGTLTSLKDDLECGKIDVALTILGLRGIDNALLHTDSDTSAILFQQPLLLATPQNHPLAQRRSIRLAELENQPIIDRIHCEFFPQECRIFESANIHPKVVYRASHEEWVITLVQAGLGLAIMPHWPDVPGVVYLPITDLDFQRTLGLQWRLPTTGQQTSQQASDLVKQFCHFASSYNWTSDRMV